jgi:crossover junction endodeoxyribonuclease RusA
MVLATPAKQGDLVCYGKGGRHILVHKDADALEDWRGRVMKAVERYVDQTANPGEPLDVGITWSLARPKSHWGTGRNADRLKPSAPAYPTSPPDLDKLTRAVFDALTKSGRLGDDAQIVDAWIRKRWATTRAETTLEARPDLDDALPVPGVVVRIYPKDQPR